MKNIIRATNSPKHHLFGFHDIVAFNQSGEKLLSLEADVINRPPLPAEQFGVGYSNWQSQEYVNLGYTNAMNYPQGARQQWLDNDKFIVNNQVGNGWGADIYDVSCQKKLGSIESTCHCVTSDSKYAFGINYSRLHRLGGYGYIGLDDKTVSDAIPTTDGIFITEIATNQTKLLVSIAQVAACEKSSSVDNGSHHYVTHLVLNPSNKRLAFLHRVFLPDGGLRTRLMTVGTNGEELRCMASGFLSHFDWKDDDAIFIWGRTGGGVDALRSNPLFSNPLVAPILGVAKGIMRKIMKKSSAMSMSFMLITDDESRSLSKIDTNIIEQDGHPMFCPTDRNLIINDTYPKSDGCRTLFFYEFDKNIRQDIGEFRMIDTQPDITLFDQYTNGVDPLILSYMSQSLFSFTRSGLHCDLHPRWNCDGSMVAFDSIHEGTRQIYIAQR
ncbi:MAG: hypothetical protein R3Y59_08550 [bacterium]